MYINRIIPVLLIKNDYLVKTIKFNKETYIGDPVNAVKIFNDKMVDEIFIIDISATKENREPNFELISRITRNAFMPLGYGGGIKNVGHVKKLLKIGVEKFCLNSETLDNPEIIKKISEFCGNQSVVVSIDIGQTVFGKKGIYDYRKKRIIKKDYISYIEHVSSLNPGEIIINTVYRDGTYLGYDYGLFKEISEKVKIPIIALGGASSINDISKVIEESGVSAASAGSLFVFQGKGKGVLINYPKSVDL